MISETVTLFLGQTSLIFSTLLIAFSIKRGATKAMTFLFGILLVWNMCFVAANYIDSALIQALMIGLSYLEGPALWWLVRVQVSGNNRMIPWPHALPFVIIVALLLNVPPDIFRWLVILAPFSRIIYSTLTIVVMLKNKNELDTKNRFYWMALLITWSLGIAIVKINFFVQFALGADWQTPMFLTEYRTMAASIILLVLTWWALAKPSVYLEFEGNKKPSPDATTQDHNIFKKLDQLLSHEDILSDSELNLARVSKLIEVKSRELSNSVNRVAGRSFRSILRQRRIELAKTMLTSSRFDHLGILTVALNSGFGTKSTFNDAFKAEAGTTPSEYRKNNRHL